MCCSGGEVAINSRTGYVYVIQSHQVAVLKGTELVSQLKTGGQDSEHLAIDGANGWVYVTHQSSNDVAVIRGTEIITRIAAVGRLYPNAIVVEPRSGWAYIASGYRKTTKPDEDPVDGNILVIKGDQVIGNIALGRRLLTHIVADSVGGYLYTGGTGGDVVVIKELKEVTRFEQEKIGGIGGSIRAMEVNPKTGEVYVVDGNDGLRRFKAGKLIDKIEVKRGPALLKVHPQTGDVYIAFGGQGWGQVVVYRDMKEIAQIEVGKGPVYGYMTVDPLTGNVYTANSYDSSVSVINGTELLFTRKVGQYPYGIAANPVNGWVYVSNFNDGTVSVLGYPPPNYTPLAPTIPVKTPTTPAKVPTAPSAPTRIPTPKAYP
jgi:DNA-binding beta-propeller fold protein YncE